ncbi:MAG: GTP cyclohydrolase I FolE [Bacteroidia bacterium]
MNPTTLAKLLDTPLLPTAFDKNDVEKINEIEQHFKAIMETLGLDLSDDSLSGTPKRVAKMFVQEIFSGLNPANKPDVTLFDNKFSYNEMLVERDINFYTTCEHHFLPFYGNAHIAYMSSGKVIGLSKLNRIVKYFAKRPQIQERLTVQIANELKKVLNTEDVAVLIDANHLCVASRGVSDVTSSTVTSSYSGQFTNESKRNEFLQYIRSK